MTRRWMAVALLPGVLALAGCGGSAAASASGASAAVSQGTSGGVQDGSGQGSGTAGQGGPGGFGAGAGGGGLFGLIAAVAGTTMQVQSDLQTAVTWTDATTVSREVATDLSAVAVGSCVVAVVDDATVDTPAATSVAVSDPVDGACSIAAGRFGGGSMPTDMPSGGPTDRPSGDAGAGMPTDRPSGAPTDMPSGRPTGTPGDGATDMPAGGFGGVVAGTVTAVDGETVTVEQDSGSTTVTVGADATVTAAQSVDATAIAVGLCVSAQGDTADNGAMTATSLTLSDPVDGACTRSARGA